MSFSKNMKKLEITLISLFISSIFYACHPLNVKQPDLTIEEIQGSWEGIFPLFAGYCRMEINLEQDGYFVVVLLYNLKISKMEMKLQCKELCWEIEYF